MQAPLPPQQSNMQPNAAQINSPGSGEGDGMPAAQPQAPAQPTPSMAPNQAQVNSPGSGEKDGAPQAQGGDNNQDAQIVQALQQHLDQLGDADKQFLAAHLTPEFVRAIGLVNGPAVANYLNQFADPSKVLVPVPRQIATQYLAKMQKQQAGQGAAPTSGQAGMQPSQPQAQPQAAPPGAGAQPSMMAPQAPSAPATSPM